MVAEQPKVITSWGWKAVLQPHGWYHIYHGNAFRGSARDAATAREWVESHSGEAYSRLPAVRLDDLTATTTGKIKTCEFPYHGWYRHDIYSHNGKELGRVQVKYIRGRTTCLTMAANYEGCVIGSDLRWMLEKNGLRLV